PEEEETMISPKPIEAEKGLEDVFAVPAKKTVIVPTKKKTTDSEIDSSEVKEENGKDKKNTAIVDKQVSELKSKITVGLPKMRGVEKVIHVIPSKMVVVGSLYSGAGSTFVAMNLARA